MTHDCNQNIESNMCPAHCRICGKDMTHNTSDEEKIRIALGELGATWEDPELVVQNILSIVSDIRQSEAHKLEEAVKDERYKLFEILQEFINDNTGYDYSGDILLASLASFVAKKYDTK
jgi:hypothetical protein